MVVVKQETRLLGRGIQRRTVIRHHCGRRLAWIDGRLLRTDRGNDGQRREWLPIMSASSPSIQREKGFGGLRWQGKVRPFQPSHPALRWTCPSCGRADDGTDDTTLEQLDAARLGSLLTYRPVVVATGP